MVRFFSVVVGAWICVLLCSCAGARLSSNSKTKQPYIVLTVIGTNDVHGRVEALPLLGGYLRNLREARRRDRGEMILLDGGDIFQGTLDSNLKEGAVMIQGYNALGYDAATIGNHEFDYGPVGPKTHPENPNDDPRGALKARLREANFPFFTSNIFESATHKIVTWQNVHPGLILNRGPFRIGIFGLLTSVGLNSTLSANVHDLSLSPLAVAAADAARKLRSQGANIVIGVAHAGGECERFDNPNDLSSCTWEAMSGEIFHVANRIPPGLVDGIVAGHTHQGVAHTVNGIPIIESFSYGKAFGRLDFHVDVHTKRIIRVRQYPPQYLCEHHGEVNTACKPLKFYEYRPVVADMRVSQILAPFRTEAATKRDEPLGLVADEKFFRSASQESPTTNWFVDQLKKAAREADVAAMDGGGIRAEIPAGLMTYGQLYKITPFDNSLVVAPLKVSEIKEAIRLNLTQDRSFLSISGVRARAECVEGVLQVEVSDEKGRPLEDDRILKVASSDYFLSARHGPFVAADLKNRNIIRYDAYLRDVMADSIRAHPTHIVPSYFYKPSEKRVRYEGDRPLKCK